MSNEPLPLDRRQLFIGGEWRPASGGDRFDVIDPADGSVLTDVADGTVDDAKAALEAAVAAQPEWAKTAPRERGEILRRAFEMVADRADDLAVLMSLEMGKTVKEAKGEVAYGNEFFRWSAEEAVRIHGRWMQAPAGGSRGLTIKKPVGPCLFVTPWNFPSRWAPARSAPQAVAAGSPWSSSRPSRHPDHARAGRDPRRGRSAGQHSQCRGADDWGGRSEQDAPG